MPEQARQAGIGADLILQTLRSHDQYNTTLYGLDDRYRGVRGCARWCSSTPPTSSAWALKPASRSIWFRYGTTVSNGALAASPCSPTTPQGQAAAYYPETNPLVPLESFGARSHTPTSKFIAIRVLPDTRTTEQQLIASGQ